MTLLPVLSLLGLTALTYAVAGLNLRIHPAWMARTLGLLTLSSLASVIAVVAITIVTFFTQLIPHGVVHSIYVLNWISAHGEVSLVLGIGMICFAVFAGIRFAAAVWSAWRYQARLPLSGAVVDAEPYAVAIPGKGGRVLISTALRELLTPEELNVVYQHERAHLDRKHHVYMGIARALSLVFPVLARVEPAMRLAVERWADEEAADAVGDRRHVAATIAKVALSRTRVPHREALGAADHEVSRRVHALLHSAGPSHHFRGSAVFGSSGILASSLASSPLQFHHVLAVLL